MSEPSEIPELLTATQVAERLQVSTRTLWRLVKAGKMPQGVHWNRKLVRWRADQVAEAIEKMRAGEGGAG